MAIWKTSALIVKASPYREHDKLLTCFALQKGKILALCKKSRHTLNKWASSFEPPVLCNIQLYEKNQYYTLTEIQLVEPFISMNQTLEKMLAIQCMTYIIDRFTVRELEHDSLFYLILSVLRFLNEQTCSPEFATAFFSIQFLKEAGFALQFQECASCHHDMKGDIFSFSPVHHGFICEKCTRDRKQFPYFPKKMMQQIELLYYCSLNEIMSQQNRNCLFNYSEIDRILKELYKGFLSKECLTMSQFKYFS